MDRLRAMQVFARVAELGNFTRVAEELGLSHGMASAIVGELEALLGVQLVRRTTRRLHLTDDGQRYLERVRPILSDIRELEDDIGGGERQPQGMLRVHAPIGFSRVVLGPALGDFVSRHPKLSVQVLSRNRFPDFVADNLDAAIYIGELPRDTLVSRSLGRMAFPVVAAPDYLARHGTPRRLADLAAHNCVGILSSQTQRPLEWRFQRDGAYVTWPTDGNLTFEASEPAVAAAVAGAGLLQMIGFLVADEIRAGRLVPVLTEFLYPGADIHFLYQRHARLPRKVRAFEDFARAETARVMRGISL